MRYKIFARSTGVNIDNDVPFKSSNANTPTPPAPGPMILQITIPTNGDSITLNFDNSSQLISDNSLANVTIDWGDSSPPENFVATTPFDYLSPTHTYTNQGNYTITISGSAEAFYGDYEDRITEVTSFGNLGIRDLWDCFFYKTNLIKLTTTLPSTVECLRGFLRGSSYNEVSICSWDTSNVKTMKEMFYQNYVFNQNIGNWNTSSVTDMSDMFNSASAFNQPLNSWNVSNVTLMYGMFSYTDNFNQNLNSWNTSSVTDMQSMFNGAIAFNGSIANWNIGLVTDVNSMFLGATSFNQNIGSWNTSNVISMNNMFNSATAFNQNIGNWNTSNVINMNYMFYNASTFNQDLSGWCVTNIPSIPTSFATGASSWVLPKPVWGTCPP